MQGKGFAMRAAAGLAVLLTASSAFASMSIPYGWYLEANAGSTNLSGKHYPGDASSSGLGGNANVGYKFFPYFGTEVGYSRYANTTVKAPDGTTAATDEHYSYDLAFRGTLPIYTSGVELFAKLGIQHNNSSVTIDNQTAASQVGIGSSSHNQVNAYYGAGAQYYFIPEIAAVIQWQRAQGNSATGTLDLFSGGLSLLVD